MGVGTRKDQIEITMADAARGMESLPVANVQALAETCNNGVAEPVPRRYLSKDPSAEEVVSSALARFRSSISGSCLIRSHRRRSAPGSDPHATTDFFLILTFFEN